jgi:very-short-patch-repair endonuclease
MVVDQAAKRINQLARAQNGLITSSQLLKAGLTRSAIRARTDRGTFVRVDRGVYAVADPHVLPLTRETSALLSLGPTAVLSHRTAAALWGLVSDHPRDLDVTLIGCKARPRLGIRLHRLAGMHPGDIRTHRNLRLTSPARTLIDFAAQASSSELESAFGEARAKRLINDRSLNAALDRAPVTHPGAAIIRRRLRFDGGSTYTRSRAERRIRRLMKAGELPQPLVNVSLNGFTVDFLWADARLILEVDGHDTHGDRFAFERDRRRDQIHVAAGYAVIRVTWTQLRDEPLAVLVRVAQALCRRAA